MAGPSVVVRILGDLKQLGSSVADAGKTAEGVGSKLRSAFSGVLSTLNRTGVLGPFGESLNVINEGLDQMGEHAKDTGDKLMAIGGIAVGVGVGLAALGSKEQSTHAQLQAAIEATGKSYDDYGDQIEAAIKHNEKFGQSSVATQQALQVLTQATGSPAKALQLLGTATDLAAAKHESLSTAATQLGRTYNGATKLLKEFGVEAATKTTVATKALESATKQAATADTAAQKAKQRLADIEAVDAGRKKLTAAQAIQLRDAEQNVAKTSAASVAAHQKLTQAQKDSQAAAKGQQTEMDALSAKLKGQAAASVDSFTGKLKVLGTEVEDQAAKFGQKYGPAITAAGSAITVLGGVMKTATTVSQSFKAAQEASTAATEATTVAEEGATTAGIGMMATMGLIVLAVVALIAIGYVIYKNWTTIWTAIKAVVVDAFNWIKTNWPLLLAILTGPVGVAVLLIVKYWDQIKAGAAAAITWVRTNWPLLLAILTGPIGLAVLAIQRNWSTITNAASSVIHWFSSTWGTVTGYITAPFTAAYGAITAGFNSMVSFVAGLPARIASAAGGMFQGIWNAFKSMVDGIADLWNGSVGSLSFKIPGWVPALGGKGFDVPDIPRLAAGGLITQTGLIYAHAGEVVAPIEKVMRTGPAVAIENAHFDSAVDVETFMRKAAWIVQTRRI